MSIKTWLERMPDRLPECQLNCTLKQIECMAAEINELRAENANLLAANRDCVNHFNAINEDYDKLQQQCGGFEADAAKTRIKIMSDELINALRGHLPSPSECEQAADMIADAAKYRWLVANAASWSWDPSMYYGVTVSGFAAHGTGYIGHTFEDALKIAMEKNP
jgi:hypothetical protein